MMWLVIATLFIALAVQQAAIADGAVNQTAIGLVRSGKIDVARASWWGFSSEDSTDALQAAINSGVKTLIVDDVGKPWVVRPLTLASNQEIIFAHGVEVDAKRGEFKGGGDSLFTAENKENISLIGYGATLRMHRDDYAGPSYKKAEWRMVLALLSCSNVKVYGLTLAESGGDGIYLGVSGDHGPCRNIHIKDVVCDKNYRQGISVISAENLLIEDSVLSDTAGTLPESGIDLEPNHFTERLVNVVLRNCVSRGNRDMGYHLYLGNLTAVSEPVSIRFENCRAEGNGKHSLSVISGATPEKAVRGTFEVDKCAFEGSGGAGISITGNPIGAIKIRLVNCSVENAAAKKPDESPVTLSGQAGDIEFVDLAVRDPLNRNPIKHTGFPNGVPAGAVTGTVIVERDGRQERIGITPEGMAR